MGYLPTLSFGIRFLGMHRGEHSEGMNVATEGRRIATKATPAERAELRHWGKEGSQQDSMVSGRHMA